MTPLFALIVMTEGAPAPAPAYEVAYVSLG